MYRDYTYLLSIFSRTIKKKNVFVEEIKYVFVFGIKNVSDCGMNWQ